VGLFLLETQKVCLWRSLSLSETVKSVISVTQTDCYVITGGYSSYNGLLEGLTPSVDHDLSMAKVQRQ